MTATERLRELLDERGVEYDKAATVIGETVATFWHDRDGYPCSAIEGADDIPDGEVSVQMCITPAQAVAATLGDADATPTRQSDADLAAENAKLRERITTQKQTIQAYRDESREWREVAERVQAENAKLRSARDVWQENDAKLRELVRDMYAVMVEDAANCDVTYPEQFDNRMRELGMEVDR